MKPRGHSATMAHVNPNRDAVNFFPTQPWGGRIGGEIIRELDPLARSIWEPGCGPGMLAHGLNDNFPIVFQSDLYRYGRHALFDFLAEGPGPFVADWIVTNPPFDETEAFVRLALQRARRGVAMLCRLAFLEGGKRWQLLYRDCRYYAVAPFSERLPLVMGCYDPDANSAAAYAWFFWLKDGVGPRVRPPRPFVIDIPPGTRARLTRPSDMQFAAMRAAA